MKSTQLFSFFFYLLSTVYAWPNQGKLPENSLCMKYALMARNRCGPGLRCGKNPRDPISLAGICTKVDVNKKIK
jgi:hypothetical protein